jgi:hypothetical protein
MHCQEAARQQSVVETKRSTSSSAAQCMQHGKLCLFPVLLRSLQWCSTSSALTSQHPHTCGCVTRMAIGSCCGMSRLMLASTCTAPCQQYNGVPNRPSAAHKQGVPLHCVCGLICTLSLGQLCSCGDCCACSPSPFHAPFLPLAFPMQTGGIGTPHPLTCGISALSS